MADAVADAVAGAVADAVAHSMADAMADKMADAEADAREGGTSARDDRFVAFVHNPQGANGRRIPSGSFPSEVPFRKISDRKNN